MTETSEETNENKNNNIQTKTQQHHETTSHLLLGSSHWVKFASSGLVSSDETLAFKRGTVAACRSGIAEEELFGKWESSISISTSAGNSMARGVAGRWDIDISCCLVVLFSLVNLYVSLVIIYYMSEIICIYIYTYMYVLTAWLVLCKVGLNSS